ncbi:MAG: plasmid pRiA4b ORF-3 family protein [Actinomycetota bacterium]
MATVHQLKVTIEGTNPPVWRRVVVSSRITLAELHDVVQAAFGWWGYHLHEFDIGGIRYGIDDGEDWDPPKDERQGRLDELAPAGSSFTYTYDFGDDWRHKITVEKVTSADPSVTYPVCTGGRRASPPEDCGGVNGYENVVAVLADPTDEEHDSIVEWVGGAFDPEAFDPSKFADHLKLRQAQEP